METQVRTAVTLLLSQAELLNAKDDELWNEAHRCHTGHEDIAWLVIDSLDAAFNNAWKAVITDWQVNKNLRYPKI